MNRRTAGLRAAAQLLIAFIIVPGIAGAVDPFIIVSDVDDTVKITNVAHLPANAFSEKAFAGMPELYRQVLGPASPARRLSFLSCSPGILLKHHLREVLNESNFPAYKLTVRRKHELISNCQDFKIRHMQEMYGASPDKFLLIGDDTESDPNVYEVFSAAKPDQVLAIYIHRITGREELPAGVIPFVTAYDIALHEFLAHRLSERQAAAVGDAVLAAGDMTFKPDFQKCPDKFEDIQSLPVSLATLKTKIENRLTVICERKKKN